MRKRKSWGESDNRVEGRRVKNMRKGKDKKGQRRIRQREKTEER